MTVIPSGQVHRVDVADLFFSTTDRRGVIALANHVFAAYARRPEDQLIGSPHNIIRHPLMPGGAFRIVWRMLESGRATAAYVLNLAGDGSAYWTFATLSPVGDAYISVRSTPCQPDVVETLEQVYRRVREREIAARDESRTAAQAAELGEELLLAELAGLGFSSYEDFQRIVVPVEVASRRAIRPPLQVSGLAAGLPRLLLDHVRVIDDKVSDLATELAGFETSAHRLVQGADAAVTAVRSVDATLRQAADTIARAPERASLLASATPALHEQCRRIADRLDAVAHRVTTLREERAQLRFTVALAQLQTEMLTRYAIALVDGTEPPHRSDAAIRELVATLDAELAAVATGIAESSSAAAGVTLEVEEAAAALRLATMSLTRWVALVQRFDLAGPLAQEVTRLEADLGAIDRHLKDLAGAAARFGSATVTFDLTTVETELKKALALSGYSRPTGAPTTPTTGGRVISLQDTVSHLERVLRS